MPVAGWSSSRSIRLVAGREIRQRIRSRPFLLATAAMCALILALGIAPEILGGDDRPSYDVAVIGAVPADLEATLLTVADQLGIELLLTDVPSREDAETALRDGSLDGAIDPSTQTVLWESSPPDELRAAVDVAWASIRAREAGVAVGLDDSQVEAILSPDPLEAIVLDLDEDEDDPAQGVGTAIGVLLFLSISMFGSYVLTGVVEEKSTGVVEVLLSQVPAHQLLAGKVCGVCIVALSQLAAMLVAGNIALAISGIVVPASVWFALPSTLYWFVGGFLLYNTLFALAGSLVSRVEDAQSAAAPITGIFLVAYLAVFAVGADTDSTVARVMSVLPPFSPLLMPLRIATGAASPPEIVVAAVLLAAAAYGMLRLAGSVYSHTLLHRGARLRWREILARRTP